MSLKLILLGNKEEKVFDFDQNVIMVGRSDENDIELKDRNCSRYHFRIKKNSDAISHLIDLNSKNGTFVNGMLVERCQLQGGEKIEIGQTIFYFQHHTKNAHEETDILTFSSTDEDHQEYESLLAKRSPEELKNQIKSLHGLVEINQALSEEHNLKKLLNLILDHSLSISGAERGFLILQEENDLEIKCSRNLDQEFIKKGKLQVSKSIIQLVLETGKIILTNDARNDERFTEVFSVHGLKLRSILCVPLQYREKAIGVLYLDNRFERGVFNKHHISLLKALSGQATIALTIAKMWNSSKNQEKELILVKKKHQELLDSIAVKKPAIKESPSLDSRKIKSPPKTKKIKKPPKTKYDYSQIITNSSKMYKIFKILDKVTDSNVPVLIQGESGTGKELIAKSLHFNSKRKNESFVSENCAAIPINLMESEFFGYEKGAFTGADKQKVGLFEVANQGTLFLDEIAEMDSEMQKKLLRVLQEGEIRRVGGEKIIKVKVRIVSACNRDLVVEAREKRFREDLLYRLNVITINLPPLRERKEDIPLLIDFFLQQVAIKLGVPQKIITDPAKAMALEYDWPGNIRELENEIERACVLSSEQIECSHFSESLCG